MKAARIHRYGGNEQVVLEEIPRPVAGPGDLLVQVRAASVNPVDFKTRDGKLKTLLRYPLPLTLGNDLSGTVVETGPGVTRFAAGDEVFARLDKDRIGTFAQFALVREGAAAKKPSGLSHIEAASIPLVGLTAWQALIELGHVQRGQRVLIHAGAGGVGSFAIQLAKHLGAHVAATASAKNLGLLKTLGADQPIDYRAQEFDQVAGEVDFVLDTQGNGTLLRSLAITRPGGRVVSIAAAPTAKFARAWGLNPFLVFALGVMSRKETRLARRRGVGYDFLFMHASGEQLGQIGALLEAGVIKPLVDKTWPLAQVKEALAFSESGHATGKVVLTVE